MPFLGYSQSALVENFADGLSKPKLRTCLEIFSVMLRTCCRVSNSIFVSMKAICLDFVELLLVIAAVLELKHAVFEIKTNGLSFKQKSSPTATINCLR